MPELMYDSHVSPGAPDERLRSVFTETRTLDLYGHQWTLAFEATPAFEAETNTLAARPQQADIAKAKEIARQLEV